MQEATPFEQVSEKEYQIKINGKFESIFCPFGKTEKLFQAFITNGGIIDPISGQVQTDLLSLIASFREVGNILLSDYDKEGELITAKSCTDLTTTEVICLFQVATRIIENFMLQLQAMQKKPEVAKQIEE